MNVSKIRLLDNSVADITNGHISNLIYSEGSFIGYVTDVNTPYVGLVLTLNFPLQVNTDTAVSRTVSLTFANNQVYTANFLVYPYTSQFVVPVNIAVSGVSNQNAISYTLINEGVVPTLSNSTTASVEQVQGQNTLNIGNQSEQKNIVVVTYPTKASNPEVNTTKTINMSNIIFDTNNEVINETDFVKMFTIGQNSQPKRFQLSSDTTKYWKNVANTGIMKTISANLELEAAPGVLVTCALSFTPTFSGVYTIGTAKVTEWFCIGGITSKPIELASGSEFANYTFINMMHAMFYLVEDPTNNIEECWCCCTPTGSKMCYDFSV